MATVTASRFASTSSHVTYGAVSSVSEPKTGYKKMGFGKQATTHNGLRALNTVYELRVKIMGNSIARQARSKSFNSTRTGSRTAGTIVCGSGMNLVFLGTEVGPWSKTGGLGDVLGGLPPAMAVSFCFLSCLIIHFLYNQWDYNKQINSSSGKWASSDDCFSAIRPVQRCMGYRSYSWGCVYYKLYNLHI